MLQSRDSEMKAYPSGCQELSGSVFLAGVDWVAFSKATGRLVLTCTNSAGCTCTSPATATAYSYDAVGRILNY